MFIHDDDGVRLYLPIGIKEKSAEWRGVDIHRLVVCSKVFFSFDWYAVALDMRLGGWTIKPWLTIGFI